MFFQHTEKEVYKGLLTACCSNVELQSWDKLIIEDVVVSRIPDGTSNDSDGQCKSRDGCDEIVGTDNSRNDRCWDNDSTDPKPSYDKNSIHGIQVVESGSGKSSTPSSHHDTRANHQGSIVTTEY